MGPTDNSQERAWVAAAQRGDRGAFDRLLATHTPRLLALAQRILGNAADAEDAVQNALASAWLALSRFDQARPLGPWLATITINKCRDAIRSRRFALILRPTGEEVTASIADDTPDQEHRLQDRQMLAQVEREIVRLPLKLREPFVLATFDNRSQADVAVILDISEKAVETRIYRARQRLREKFADM